jgi:hypothetical protein
MCVVIAKRISFCILLFSLNYSLSYYEKKIKHEVNFERFIHSSTLYVTTNIHTQHHSQHAYKEHNGDFFIYFLIHIHKLANITYFFWIYLAWYKKKCGSQSPLRWGETNNGLGRNCRVEPSKARNDGTKRQWLVTTKLETTCTRPKKRLNWHKSTK